MLGVDQGSIGSLQNHLPGIARNIQAAVAVGIEAAGRCVWNAGGTVHEPRLSLTKLEQLGRTSYPEIAQAILGESIPIVNRQTGGRSNWFCPVSLQTPYVALFAKPHIRAAYQQAANRTGHHLAEAIRSRAVRYAEDNPGVMFQIHPAKAIKCDCMEFSLLAHIHRLELCSGLTRYPTLRCHPENAIR